MTVDQPLDVSNIIQTQIEQLIREIEELQERLLALSQRQAAATRIQLSDFIH
jgi:hypothetical protein